MNDVTKKWTQSKIMIRALLVMIIGVLTAVLPFLKTLNIDLVWLNTLAKWLTIGNVDVVMKWIEMALQIILPILGLTIWIERKRSQGEKIAGKNPPKFPRTYHKR
jgi:hypothetical protein